MDKTNSNKVKTIWTVLEFISGISLLCMLFYIFPAFTALLIYLCIQFFYSSEVSENLEVPLIVATKADIQTAIDKTIKNIVIYDLVFLSCLILLKLWLS